MPRLTTLLFFLAACAGESTQPEPEDTGDPTTEEETEAAPPSPGLAIGESDPTDRRSEDVAPAIDMPETEIDWEIPEVPCAHMRAFSHVSNAGTFSEEETTDEAGRLTSWSFEVEAEQYAYISGPPDPSYSHTYPEPMGLVFTKRRGILLSGLYGEYLAGSGGVYHTYDADGRLTESLTSFSFQDAYHDSWTYDTGGRPIRRTRQSETGSTLETETWTYDSAGQLSIYRYEDPEDSWSWAWTWSGGFPSSAEKTEGGAIVQTATYELDPSGNYIERAIRSLSEPISYYYRSYVDIYDADGRKIEYAEYNDPNPGGIDPAWVTRKRTWTYDGERLMTFTTYENEHTGTYSYTYDGSLLTRIDYAHTDFGEGPGSWVYTYDADGLRASATHQMRRDPDPSEYTESYVYDEGTLIRRERTGYPAQDRIHFNSSDWYERYDEVETWGDCPEG